MLLGCHVQMFQCGSIPQILGILPLSCPVDATLILYQTLAAAVECADHNACPGRCGHCSTTGDMGGNTYEGRAM